GGPPVPGGRTAFAGAGLAGPISTALAVICLMRAPFGSPRVLWPLPKHPEGSVLRDAGWTRSLLVWELLRAAAMIGGLALAGPLGTLPGGMLGAAAPSIVARTLAVRP